MRGLHANDCRCAQPERARIDPSTVADDHALVLKSLDALGHCRLRQGQTPSQFGKRDAAFALQGFDDGLVDLVQPHHLGWHCPFSLAADESSADRRIGRCIAMFTSPPCVPASPDIGILKDGT
jgi:hypothetical protein